MKKEEKLFRKYYEQLIPGITAIVLEIPKRGIMFKSEYITVNVYIDGSIYTENCPEGQDILEYIKSVDETMFKLIRAVSNDFKIMELRESCSDSLMYREYNQAAVDAKIKDWEKDTGNIVNLTDTQKEAIYDEVFSNSIFSTTSEITKWLVNRNIPFVSSGNITISVNSDTRNITIINYGRSPYEKRFDIPQKVGIESQIDDIIEVVRDTLFNNLES